MATKINKISERITQPRSQGASQAMLLGTGLPVEKGKDTGTFKSIPLCKSATQTG